MKVTNAILTVVIISTACVEVFEPRSGEYKEVLVVEGHLSDAREPQTVLLSRTRPLTATGNVPETSAIVAVADNSGRRYTFQERSPGVYQSDTTEFSPMVGEYYSLHITTQNGRSYRSDKVLLKKAPPIDEVYFEEVERLDDEGKPLWGIQVLLDSHDPANLTRYYRWEWIQNWEIKVPRPSQFEFVEDPDTIGGGYPVARANSVEFCYNSNSSTAILVADASNHAGNRISRAEMNFLNTRGPELRSFYGIIVRQYALDETGYRYWSELKKTTENLGTIFDPLPYELVGNVKCETEPDEPVFGYFDASSFTVNSLVLERDQLIKSEFPFEQCFGEIDSVPYSRVPEYLRLGYLIDSLGIFGKNFVYMAPATCSDCRLFGTLERPQFRPE